MVLLTSVKPDYSDPKAYRPIGLLPVLGTILEKLLITRIRWHILHRLSTCQYGFMPQKRTEDSLYNLMKRIRDKLNEKKFIVMVSLDIEGNFGSGWWPAIRTRLAEENCPINLRRVISSYLRDRRVMVRFAEAKFT